MSSFNNDSLPGSPSSPSSPSKGDSKPQRLMRGASSFNLDEKDYVTTEEGLEIKRNRTKTETEVMKRSSAARVFIDGITDTDFDVGAYIPNALAGSIFVGHLVTDMDSIAGSIGAADLYGGVSARASAVNSETKFCLDYWGMAKPQPIEDLVVQMPDAGICLVDHQQMSQLNPVIDTDRIVGVIDHHALQNATIVTDRPIYIDIRPWGSMSTIIAHNYFNLKKVPRKCVAGMLLCAILSDTLNLMGPTTTDWDRAMVAVLAQITDTKDINLLASKQFKAKSQELAGLSAAQLVTGDQKSFSFKTDVFSGVIGFAVIETTDDDVIMQRKSELLMALKADKASKNLDGLFLAVVNIVKLKSQLLVCGDLEKELAIAAFKEEGYVHPADADPAVLDMGGLVSRKKDYIPPLTKAIKLGFSYK